MVLQYLFLISEYTFAWQLKNMKPVSVCQSKNVKKLCVLDRISSDQMQIQSHETKSWVLYVTLHDPNW